MTLRADTKHTHKVSVGLYVTATQQQQSKSKLQLCDVTATLLFVAIETTSRVQTTSLIVRGDMHGTLYYSCRYTAGVDVLGVTSAPRTWYVYSGEPPHVSQMT
uniref:Uncharacterized protein n=1 Tax=Lygus hesperus TaxID=30085 RepID=A0A146M1L4_LYGHE